MSADYHQVGHAQLYPHMYAASVEPFAEAIAKRVAEILGTPKHAAPMTREQAAEYCGLTVRTFDRERKRVPGTLAPMGATGPLSRRWSKDCLDLYLFAGGRLTATRRGRPRKNQEQAA